MCATLLRVCTPPAPHKTITRLLFASSLPYSLEAVPERSTALSHVWPFVNRAARVTHVRATTPDLCAVVLHRPRCVCRDYDEDGQSGPEDAVVSHWKVWVAPKPPKPKRSILLLFGASRRLHILAATFAAATRGCSASS